MSEKRFRFAIDRGGTFTDIYCEIYDSIVSESHANDEEAKNSNSNPPKSRILKLLSEDPLSYNDAPTEGIRRLLESELGYSIPRNIPVPTNQIDYIRMGTTVATNALLERKGERMALLTTKGFGDLQQIGNQSRPKIFDLEIRRLDLLYEFVVELDERVIILKDNVHDANECFYGLSHELLYVEKPIDENEVTRCLKHILGKGIKSIAVALMHSYTFPTHELKIKEIAEQLGFEQISLSSEIMPMVKIVPRGCTTCVDAYLTPIIKRYLHSFSKGFDQNFANVNVTFMQSDGGLTPMESFLGNRAILSGPAGGVVGFAMTSYFGVEKKMPVIGFDMGMLYNKDYSSA